MRHHRTDLASRVVDIVNREILTLIKGGCDHTVECGEWINRFSHQVNIEFVGCLNVEPEPTESLPGWAL